MNLYKLFCLQTRMHSKGTVTQIITKQLNKIMMKRSILLFLGIIFLIACNPDDRPAGIIEHQKMVAVLTDMHLVDNYIQNVPRNDTLRQNASVYRNAVYKKHQTNKTEFDKSLKYYSGRPKLLDSMYSQVLTALEKKEIKESKHKVPVKKHDLPQ